MDFYRIGPLTVCSQWLPNAYQGFKVIENRLSQEELINSVRLSKSREPFELEKAHLIAEHMLMKVWQSEDKDWIFEEVRGRGMLKVSRDYGTGIYWIEEGGSGEEALSPLIQAMVECRMIASGVSVLHAACVKTGNRAVAFSGPSGTGKSTRASRWVDVLGAEWISGDRPAIDPVHRMVYGVPWDGKEQIFNNVSCPLHCILEVHRSSSTMIRKLSAKQAYHFLASQVLVPMWDPLLAAKAMVELRQITENIPVYRLFCDWTDLAAKETMDMLFNKTMMIKPYKEDKSMKLKEGFEIVDIAGDYMAIPTGSNMATYGGNVILNEVSAFLLKQMKQNVSKEDLVELMLNEYEVDRETASADIDEIIMTFTKLGLVE